VIVEFIGCTGAGKTTIARQIQACNRPGCRAVVGSDLVLGWPGLRRITNATAANVIQDIYGLPFFLAMCRKDWQFIAMAVRMLRLHAPSRFDQLMNLRSVMRRMGMFGMAQSRADGRAILVDEGPVLIAYHLFIYSTADLGTSELERFAELVPLPDWIVYVKAPVASLVARARARSDPRRQLAALGDAGVTESIERANLVFDRLVACERIRERVLIVDNSVEDSEERARLIDALATQVQVWTSTVAPVGTGS
jgi:hypothetical protein